ELAKSIDFKSVVRIRTSPVWFLGNYDRGVLFPHRTEHKHGDTRSPLQGRRLSVHMRRRSLDISSLRCSLSNGPRTSRPLFTPSPGLGKIIPQGSLRILSSQKRGCNVYITKRCGGFCLAI